MNHRLPHNEIVVIPAPVLVYSFGKFELLGDPEELRKAGALVHLPPQPLRVLRLLVSRAGQIVTRNEIREAVWGSSTFVDYDQGVNTAIRQVRRALVDTADIPHFLQTIPRRGYRFIAPVRVIAPKRVSTVVLFGAATTLGIFAAAFWKRRRKRSANRFQ